MWEYGVCRKIIISAGHIFKDTRMSNWVVSRYNHDISYLREYVKGGDTILALYDRSENPLPDSIKVPNIGSDLYDKFSFIIDNYENLPDAAIYTKANLLKYISKEEFELVKENKTYTPLLTRHHRTYFPVCWYENGLFAERQDYWYLNVHPAKYENEIREIFKMDERKYNLFAPGSNYILPRENILKHLKSFYEQLRSYLDWSVYPGDAQLLERNLWYLWQ